MATANENEPSTITTASAIILLFRFGERKG
jgi:hypothetical protein